MSRLKRLERLEAAQREWQRTHVPLRDLPGFLLEVLEIVSDEAGRATAMRIANRMVQGKAQQVAALLARVPE